ncbi:hypothetical protein LIER_22742 [Lithospermum erythrorhizon]|uniref:DUF4283 domain-containing protein n=1 Tax=Lithospermum erythrorhizon TaxID=34254 RepID=A0AAV3QV37_LITER
MSESPKVNFQSTQTLALNLTSVSAAKGGDGGREVENPVICTAQQQCDHKSTYAEVESWVYPNFITIEKFESVKWREFGFEKMFKLASGLFLFQFGDDDGRDQMIVEGPWIFAQHLMILNPWTPESRLERKGVKRVPDWTPES